MDGENTSRFFDSIVEQPHCLCLSLNESSILEGASHIPNSCSTPNVNANSLERQFLKRKFSGTDNTTKKFSKIIKFQNPLASTEKHAGNNNTSMSFQNNSVLSDSCEADITVIPCNSSNKENVVILKDDCSSKLETNSNTIKKDTFGYSSQEAISILVEDDYLLISSDDNEDDKDIESYYHLLDSPNQSNDEDSDDVTIINETSAPIILVSSSSENTDESNETANESTTSCTSANKLKTELSEISFVEIDKITDVSSFSPCKIKPNICAISNTDNVIKSNLKPFKSRSVALKPFIQSGKYSRKKKYPKWLENARENCTYNELLKLMESIYEQPNPMSHDWYAIEDLSLKNYRNALFVSGLSPDRLPKNRSANFYLTEPSASFKRFAMK